MKPVHANGALATLASVVAFVIACLVLLAPKAAWAQACCAGSGAVTPGRLALHEDQLIGFQARAAHVLGAYDKFASYIPRAGYAEQDFEQDVFGSFRLPFAPRAQISALVPFVETRRKAAETTAFGGGIGDVNLSARYDFLYAGQSRFVPGIAALAGITFPTGTAPEATSSDLAVDATGIGAFQANVGIAVEQTFGPWLVTAYALAAQRTKRHLETVEVHLATQWTGLLAVAYTFPGDYALALSASYTGEGNSESNGKTSDDSARRVATVGLSGVVPFTDHFRMQGALTLNPPFSSIGQNQLATVGIAVTAIYAWY